MNSKYVLSVLLLTFFRAAERDDWRWSSSSWEYRAPIGASGDQSSWPTPGQSLRKDQQKGKGNRKGRQKEETSFQGEIGEVNSGQSEIDVGNPSYSSTWSQSGGQPIQSEVGNVAFVSDLTHQGPIIEMTGDAPSDELALFGRPAQSRINVWLPDKEVKGLHLLIDPYGNKWKIYLKEDGSSCLVSPNGMEWQHNMDINILDSNGMKFQYSEIFNSDLYGIFSSKDTSLARPVSSGGLSFIDRLTHIIARTSKPITLAGDKSAKGKSEEPSLTSDILRILGANVLDNEYGILELHCAILWILRNYMKYHSNNPSPTKFQLMKNAIAELVSSSIDLPQMSPSYLNYIIFKALNRVNDAFDVYPDHQSTSKDLALIAFSKARIFSFEERMISEHYNDDDYEEVDKEVYNVVEFLFFPSPESYHTGFFQFNPGTAAHDYERYSGFRNNPSQGLTSFLSKDGEPYFYYNISLIIARKNNLFYHCIAPFCANYEKWFEERFPEGRSQNQIQNIKCLISRLILGCNRSNFGADALNNNQWLYNAFLFSLIMKKVYKKFNFKYIDKHIDVSFVSKLPKIVTQGNYSMDILNLVATWHHKDVTIKEAMESFIISIFNGEIEKKVNGEEYFIESLDLGSVLGLTI